MVAEALSSRAFEIMISRSCWAAGSHVVRLELAASSTRLDRLVVSKRGYRLNDILVALTSRYRMACTSRLRHTEPILHK